MKSAVEIVDTETWAIGFREEAVRNKLLLIAYQRERPARLQCTAANRRHECRSRLCAAAANRGTSLFAIAPVLVPGLRGGGRGSGNAAVGVAGGRNGVLDVTPVHNGPLEVNGNLDICAGTGRTTDRVTNTRLCRCGQSQDKPFRDGSHLVAGFVADGGRTAYLHLPATAFLSLATQQAVCLHAESDR